MKISAKGRVTALLIADDPKTLASHRVPAIEATFEGFVGDKHAGFTKPADGRTPYYPRGMAMRNDRQLSLISVEEMAATAADMHLPEIKPEWLGANLLIEGIPDFTLLPPSSLLFFEGGVTLYLTGENRPCPGPGKLIQAAYQASEKMVQDFIRAAQRRRGLVGVVEKPGRIVEGEQVSLFVPQYTYHTPD